jgi:hypothetical protein
VNLPTKVAAPIVLALALAGAAAAQSPQQPPDIHIPDLPKQEVERFKVTLNGSQGSTFNFAVDYPNESCPIHSEGRVTENWEFARGRGVVLEFRRIKGTRTVFLQRKGHPAGDVSFATPGTVIRTASGFWDEMGPAPCRGHHVFGVADCDTKHPAKADMFFIWTRRGKLTMEPTSKSIQRKSPAAACGGGVDYIDGLTNEYPFLSKQKGTLTAKQVFGKRKHIVVPLKAAPLIEPVREGMWIREDEVFGGSSRLVLSRLKD